MLEGERWKLIRLLQEESDKDQIDALLKRTRLSSVFNHLSFSSTLMVDIVMLLTFGVLFPPLAIIILASIMVFVVDYLMALKILINLSANSEAWTVFLGYLDAEISRAEALLFHPLLYMNLVIAMFWSFTLFDTLGAEVEAVQALWMPVLMSASPILWYGLWWMAFKWRRRIVGMSKQDDDQAISGSNPIHSESSIIEMI